MGTSLNQPSLGTSIFGNLLGSNNSSYASAANNVFNVGQYQPYTVNNPMGQTSFSGGTANSTLSPLQQSLQSQFGSQIQANAGASTYNPNTSFLPQQYQSIFGNMQGNVNSQYNALQQAQQPFTQQYLQSNLDNEQAKGTLASTAGSYQTAGAQTAANAQSNANYAQAQNYALNTANSQFGAAGQTAGLGEQQSEFGPQFAQSQTQGLFSNLLNQNQLSAQITGLGGSLGAQQSSANTNAAMPQYQASLQQASAQNSLTNGLLFGNGGLLTSLLGTGGSSGSGGLLGSLGSGLSSLFGGGQQSGSAAATGSLGMNTGYDNYFGGTGASNNAQGSIDSDFSDQLGNTQMPDFSFNGAGGQAAEEGGATSDGVPQEVQSAGLDSLNQGGPLTEGSPMSSFGLNDLGAGVGIAGDLASGTTAGYAKGALSGAQLASSNGLFGANSSGIGGLANSGLSALGLVQGIQAGGVTGGLEAAASGARLAASAGAATGALSSGAASALSSAAGAVAVPLSLYNFAKTWQSGDTGSDTLSGAETGASVGSVFGPVGTVIGGVIGAAAGALSSAFGAGKVDPETTNMYAANQAGSTSLSAASPAASFNYLTGVMDAKNPTAGHSTVLEQVFGREGESSVLNGMAGAINTALQKGTITSSTPSSQLFSSVIQPWLTSKGVSASSLTFTDAKGNNSGSNLQNALTNLGSSYLSGQLTSKTSLDSQGQQDAALPTLFQSLS